MRLGPSLDIEGLDYDPSGYDVLGPLLEHGSYHEDFIAPIAEHLIRLDANSRLGEFAVPLNSSLLALDRNPVAAAEVLSGSHDYSDVEYPGFYRGDEELGPVESGNLQYLLDRVAAYDEDDNGPFNPGRLGNTIESATTGLSTHAEAGTVPLPQTEQMRGLTRELVEYVGDNPSTFAGPDATMDAMLDNFGNITAHFIDDFHQSQTSSESLDDAWVPETGTDSPLFGTHDSREESDVDRWLQVIGHDKGATAVVWGASDALMTSELGNVDGATHEGATDVGEIFETHGRITGNLTTGQLDGIEQGEWAEANAHNNTVDNYATGAKIGVAVAVGWFQPEIPLATAVAEEEIGGLGIDWVADFFRDHPEEQIAEMQDAASARALAIAEDDSTLTELRATLRDAGVPEDQIPTHVQNYIERYVENVNSP